MITSDGIQSISLAQRGCFGGCTPDAAAATVGYFAAVNQRCRAVPRNLRGLRQE